MWDEKKNMSVREVYTSGSKELKSHDPKNFGHSGVQVVTICCKKK